MTNYHVPFQLHSFQSSTSPCHSTLSLSSLPRGCALTKALGQPYSSGIGCFCRLLSTRPAPFCAGCFFCFPPCSHNATSFALGHWAPLPSAVNSASPSWRWSFFLLSAGYSLPLFSLHHTLSMFPDPSVEGESPRAISGNSSSIHYSLHHLTCLSAAIPSERVSKLESHSKGTWVSTFPLVSSLPAFVKMLLVTGKTSLTLSSS